jgi:hypothetical protein
MPESIELKISIELLGKLADNARQEGKTISAYVSDLLEEMLNE